MGPKTIYLEISDDDVSASEVFLFHRAFVKPDNGSFMIHLDDGVWFIKAVGWLDTPDLSAHADPDLATYIREDGYSISITYDWVADVAERNVT